MPCLAYILCPPYYVYILCPPYMDIISIILILYLAYNNNIFIFLNFHGYYV